MNFHETIISLLSSIYQVSVTNPPEPPQSEAPSSVLTTCVVAAALLSDFHLCLSFIVQWLFRFCRNYVS